MRGTIRLRVGNIKFGNPDFREFMDGETARQQEWTSQFAQGKFGLEQSHLYCNALSCDSTLVSPTELVV